jgi:hypothetical protein
VVAANGKVVVYMGDDERNEYIYKFVSSGSFDRSNPTSAANRRLLESGTLYVARFDAGATTGDGMGTGTWIPLVHGSNGLTAANGFANQAEVLIKCRQAADRVGATMMDRPEWISANPKKAGRGLPHADQQQPPRRHHVQRGGRQRPMPARPARRSTKPTRAPTTSGATSCAGTKPAAMPPR